MPSFIIVDKNGSVKCTNSKTLNLSELYKKCGFKSADGFSCAHTWNVNDYQIQVYGKTTGRAGSENKYEFPPPIDSVLFFGSCAVINMQDDKIVDINTTEFNDIMDYLQGGYSDIDSEESEQTESDDLDIPKTKQGYAKDGFVVDDDESDDTESTLSSEELPKKKGKSKGKGTCKPKATITSAKAVAQKYLESINIPVSTSKDVLECSEELVEEEYV